MRARPSRATTLTHACTLHAHRRQVAALPLQPASVDALHAGAAMHCWPRLEDGLRQIRACLKPGGRFFATTFLQGAYGVPVTEGGGAMAYRFFQLDELRELLVGAGFDAEGVEVRQEGQGCAVIKVRVPSEAEPSAGTTEASDEAEEMATETKMAAAAATAAAADATAIDIDMDMDTAATALEQAMEMDGDGTTATRQEAAEEQGVVDEIEESESEARRFEETLDALD